METFSVLLALCVGIHWSPVNSPHKGQWHGALIFPLICTWINGWINNREAGDLRPYHAHYDVTVMKCIVLLTGHDGLKSIYIKLSGTHLCNSLCDLFNMCVTASFFPSEIKLAEISPIFKRNDNLCKENNRSINLLTITSKLFKNIMSDQLTKYFGDLLCSTLSAYRKGYSCQHLILRFTEYWRRALDNGNAVGTVAMISLSSFR